MDNNYFMWRCDEEKCLKILTSLEVHKERLGWKLNSEWFIVIELQYHSAVNFSGYVGNFKNQPFRFEFKFFLCRNESLEDIKVKVRQIKNSTIQPEIDLYFEIGTLKHSIFNLESTDLKNFPKVFIFIFPKNNNPENITEYPAQISKDCNLKDDLLTMLTKAHFSDVTLKCNCEIMKAHKNILSARSPVFETMFKSPMQESEEGMVVIKDMSPDAFRSMMHFVYGGEIQFTSLTSACDLLYAAEKYQLKGLKQVCLDYLKSIMTTENSIQVLETADLHDVRLKQHAISFIKDHFEDLQSTKDWRELKQRKPALALEVYSTAE